MNECAHVKNNELFSRSLCRGAQFDEVLNVKKVQPMEAAVVAARTRGSLIIGIIGNKLGNVPVEIGEIRLCGWITDDGTRHAEWNNKR